MLGWGSIIWGDLRRSECMLGGSSMIWVMLEGHKVF